MATVSRWINGKLVTEELKTGSPSLSKKRPRQRPDPMIVRGIIDYLQLAESDGYRYRDVLNEFMISQSAATMKAVAAQRVNGRQPKTKAEAKRILVEAYNLSAAIRAKGNV